SRHRAGRPGGRCRRAGEPPPRHGDLVAQRHLPAHDEGLRWPDGQGPGNGGHHRPAGGPAMKIGIMLPIDQDEVTGRPLGWDALREISIAAEEGGLDSVWAADHLIFRSRDGRSHGIRENWTVLTAVAAVTSRVEIGPLVLALPFRNPALVA